MEEDYFFADRTLNFKFFTVQLGRAVYFMQARA